MKKLICILAVAILAVSVASAATLTIRPDGQGAKKGWGNVGCGNGNDEWQCVDDVVVNTSDYLKTAGTKKETFTFSDTGLGSEDINSVTLYYYAMEHNKPANSCFEAMVRDGSTEYFAGTQLCVGSSWEYVSHTYTTNPATGLAWTVSEVDALEAGMHGLNPNGGGRIAQVYAEVNYTNTTNLTADLIVDVLDITEYTTINGSTNATNFTAFVRVKNVGTAAATGFHTDADVTPGSGDSFYTSSLGVGQVDYYFFDGICLPGGVSITATVDYTSLVLESDETNNQATTSVDCVL